MASTSTALSTGDNSDCGAGGHPDAARAREIADAIKRLDEMERQVQQGHMNPELIEDIRRTKAILQDEIRRIFEIGQ